MMADLVLKLLDKSIELLKVKKEKRQYYFANAIEPLFQDFESLHNDYLKSFEKYREIIKASSSFDSTHPIFDLVVKEHLFSQSVRGKIRTSYKLFPPYSNSKKLQRDELEEFLYRVNSYVNKTTRFVYENDHRMMSNWPRSSLISGIRFIFSIDYQTGLQFIERINQRPFVAVENSNPSKFVGTGKYRTPTDYYLFAFYFDAQRIQRNPSSKYFDVILQGIWAKLKSELQATNGDLNKVKSVLAVALIDTIVANIQSDYEDVLESFLELKKCLLK